MSPRDQSSVMDIIRATQFTPIFIEGMDKDAFLVLVTSKLNWRCYIKLPSWVKPLNVYRLSLGVNIPKFLGRRWQKCATNLCTITTALMAIALGSPSKSVFLSCCKHFRH